MKLQCVYHEVETENLYTSGDVKALTSQVTQDVQNFPLYKC